jgi:hypothetical protein
VPANTGYQSGNGESGKGEVFEHATRMVDEARAFGNALSGSMEDLSVGYVLGGGLFSPVTARLLRIGLRLALVPLIKSQINTFSQGTTERTPDSGAI